MIAIGISLFGICGIYFLSLLLGTFIRSRIIEVVMVVCACLIIFGLFFGLAISFRHDLLSLSK